MLKMNKNPIFPVIPTKLSIDDFNEFILPHLSVGKRGPKSKVPFYKTFHYIMKVLHTGMQWRELSIDQDHNGKPEISSSRIHRHFVRWCSDEGLRKEAAESEVAARVFFGCWTNSTIRCFFSES